MPLWSRAAPATFALLLAAWSAGATEVDRIVATVDGEPITAHELDRYAAENARVTTDRNALLDALITEKILAREAAAKGISVKDADVDAYVAQVKQRNRMDDASFEQALKGQGLTLQQYRTRVKGELEKSQLVNREIRARVSVSPEEIERYYDAHKDEFATGAGITLSGIMLRVEPLADDAEVGRVKAKAEDLRRQAAEGANFAKLAKEHSQGQGAQDGGRLGTFGPGELAPALASAVRGLQEGQVSEVVRTDSGFYILRVDDVSSEDVRPLDEVRDQIRERLYDEELQKRFEGWLQKDLRERHSVEILQ